MILITCAIIFVLILLSAFFSGSETAFTAVSAARLRAAEHNGDTRATPVLEILDKKEKMIGALLLGNNLVNILASALATSVFIKIFGEAGVVYATLVMTLLVLIFAEVLPKTFALHHASGMTRLIAPIIKLLIIVLSPITQMIAFIVRRTLRVLGADISRVASGAHVELLRGAIELHDGEEEEVQTQRAMLRSILDLAEIEVEEIMTHRKNVEMINLQEDEDTIVMQVLNSQYTRHPIFDGDQDNIIGVLHSKALLRALQESKGGTEGLNFRELATDPWFIPDATHLYAQLQAFKQRREHFAVVVDEYGSFLGIVTLEDILEEIVGEIDDEHDVAVTGVRVDTDGSILAQGTVTIRDLNREFNWKLPDDEDYATIAGLLLYESQTVPDAGQSFIFHGFRFNILRKTGNQIALIRMKQLEE
ncbi:MAG: hypothetical protein CMH25_00820 [Micavibrio sp.]|nr:hypothetical protein [Micavibrio sp.]|tara:strand:+ start:165084 stop:166343 length:1260 start_codon:yes stop_codon:yes gene_type:complete